MTQVMLTGTIEKRGTHYVSRCNEFDIFTYADTFEDVIVSIEDMIANHFDALRKIGRLDAELVRLSAGSVHVFPDVIVPFTQALFRGHVKGAKEFEVEVPIRLAA